MSVPVIRAEALGKLYRRGQIQENGLLRDSLARFARSPLSAFRRDRQETFWALKDVALEVREGEVLGLIGRNGAGKTTLLKILSRITQPTTGWAEIHGRVGSLLEVGTGFHPELSGHGHAPTASFLVSTVAVLVILFGRLVFFQRMEGTVADRV